MAKKPAALQSVGSKMHVIDVMPISRGIGKEALSYFVARSVRPGHLVSIPLRKRVVPALVLSCAPAEEAKASVRRRSYPLRKARLLTENVLLSSAFMRAARETARYFAAATGAALHALTPSALWELERMNARSARLRHTEEGFALRTASGPEPPVEPERLVFQAEPNERLARYRSIIREAFARNASVFIAAPTTQECESLGAYLKRGIGQYLIVLHGSLGKKEQQERWHLVQTVEHPIAVVGTPPFLAVERNDIETIVLERESASVYKQPARPFIDLRFFIERYARAKRARLILAAFPLRIETQWRYYSGELDTLVPLKQRVQSTTAISIHDTREARNPERIPQKRKPFQVLGDALKHRLEQASAKGGRLFLFAARRGLAPMTVCADCGNPVTCLDSNEPAVLYRGLTGNVFVCHSTGVSRSAEERCHICRSWRLQTLGIGIQKAEEEIRNLFPGLSLLTLDSTSVRTHRQAQTLTKKFYGTERCVLLGTEKALPYLTAPIPSVAVLSVDALLSHPEWRMAEKTFGLLLALQDVASERLLIQTRRPNEPLLEFISAADIARFYRSEIEQRGALRYPPFSALIKITAAGTPARVQKEMRFLEEHLAEYKLHVYLPTVQMARGRFSMHGLLRVPRSEWPNKKLLARLEQLPPHFAVNVDPQALLST